MYNYIFDPNTNQKISLHSKLGRNIIKQYLIELIGGKPLVEPVEPTFFYSYDN